MENGGKKPSRHNGCARSSNVLGNWLPGGEFYHTDEERGNSTQLVFLKNKTGRKKTHVNI